MARYLILHKYGGIYADIDFEAVGPVGSYIRELQERLVLMDSNKKKHEDVQNSLMASAVGHPFWLEVFKLLQERRPSVFTLDVDIISTTGPGMLSEAVQRWEVEHPKIACFEFKAFMNGGRGKDNIVDLDITPFTVHHYSHRWLWEIKEEKIHSVTKWLLVVMLALYFFPWHLIQRIIWRSKRRLIMRRLGHLD